MIVSPEYYEHQPSHMARHGLPSGRESLVDRSPEPERKRLLQRCPQCGIMHLAHMWRVSCETCLPHEETMTEAQQQGTRSHRKREQ